MKTLINSIGNILLAIFTIQLIGLFVLVVTNNFAEIIPFVIVIVGIVLLFKNAYLKN